MLPKINRLKNTKDINRVFKTGRVAKEGSLLLKFTKNRLEASRFAFVVSSKTAPKAVFRNKIKRRLRAALRHILPLLATGVDAVIVAQAGAQSKSAAEIKEDVQQLFKRAKLWNF